MYPLLTTITGGIALKSLQGIHNAATPGSWQRDTQRRLLKAVAVTSAQTHSEALPVAMLKAVFLERRKAF